MATGHLRDLDRLAEGLMSWRARREPGGDGVTVAGIAHASAGWANETVVVHLRHPDGADEGLVLRMPPLEPSFPEYRLAGQAAVHRAVAAAGVPAPVPVTVEEDPHWLGAPFMTMPFVPGHVPGELPVFDRWITAAPPAAQRAVVEALVDTLVAVHTLDWAAAGLGGVLRGAEGGLAGELDWWERYLWWVSADPLEVLRRALAWCRARLPGSPSPVSLLWGDPRLGNLVFEDHHRLAAVLDWELACLGPPEVDLGWYLAQDRTQAELLGRRVEGFPAGAEVLERHRAGTGRPARDMGFYEVFALLRMLAVDVRQAQLARRAEVPYPTAPDASNPLVGVLERAMAGAGRPAGG